MMKRICILAAALAATASLALVGCGDNKSGSAHHEETQTGTYRGIESTESIFGISAVTTAKLLAVTEAPAAASSTESLAFTAEGTQDAVDKVEREAEDFNKYFNILDTFLDRGATTTVVEDNASADAALAGYAFKLTITGRNAAGEDVPHTMYYSETKGETNTTNRLDGDETVTTSSTVYTLEGVVELGADEAGTPVYSYMRGTRTEQTVTETEGRETETEQISTLSLRASATAGDTQNYVELTHTQTSEQEGAEAETEAVYTYRTYVAGQLAEATSVEFETETEHGEEETEYTVRFLSGASRGVYEIEREVENGRTEIAVRYSIDGATGRFVIIKNADGTYLYKFSGNSSETFRDFDD